MSNLTILTLIKWLQRIIPIAAIIPIAQNLLNLNREEEQTTMYRRRIRNVILFVIVSELAVEILEVFAKYIHL